MPLLCGNMSLLRIPVSRSASSGSACLFVIYHRFLSHPDYSYVLNYLKLHTVSARRRYWHVLFLTNLFSDWKYCPALLETVCLRLPDWGFREFSLLNVDFRLRNCPSARCISAINAVGSATDILIGHSDSVNFSFNLFHPFVKNVYRLHPP